MTMKRSLVILLEVIAATMTYYILSSIIENRLILIVLVLLAGAIVVIVNLFLINNDAIILERSFEVKQYFEHIDKFKHRDSNKYNTLLAYGLSYTGEFDKAEQALSNVSYEDIRTSKNLHYDYFVAKLHLLYNNKEKEMFKSVLQQAKENNVFTKVELPAEIFDGHMYVLEENFQEAKELLIEIIPVVQKKIMIIELEYILASAYYNQNEIEDCKAVCDFVIQKNRPIVYTELCKELYSDLK